MSMLDGLLGQLAGNVNIQQLAAKVGLTPGQVEQAVHALGVAHPQPGDTVQTASAQTGLPTDVLQQIVGHLGGEGGLAQFSTLLHGEEGGAIMGSLGGFASGLFGRG